MKTRSSAQGEEERSEQQPQRVIVTDIHMSFWSMVGFMVKWAIASIPAFVILVLIVRLYQYFVWGTTPVGAH
jgi:hypothetical protein